MPFCAEAGSAVCGGFRGWLLLFVRSVIQAMAACARPLVAVRLYDTRRAKTCQYVDRKMSRNLPAADHLGRVMAAQGRLRAATVPGGPHQQRSNRTTGRRDA